MGQVQAIKQQAASRQVELLSKREALRVREDKRRADAWCLVDLQEKLSAVRSDVDAFVKGKRNQRSGSKCTDVCRCCGKKSHWARDCNGGARGDDGKRSSEGKGAGKKFDGYCRNCAQYGHKSDRPVQRSPRQQEQERQAKENAGEDADKDIGGLSNASCTVRIDLMSEDVEKPMD